MHTHIYNKSFCFESKAIFVIYIRYDICCERVDFEVKERAEFAENSDRATHYHIIVIDF